MISIKLANLFGLRYILDREGNDPCDDWDINLVMELPEGLWYANGAVQYECESCHQATELPIEPEEFEYGHPHNVCGRSPRCCP